MHQVESVAEFNKIIAENTFVLVDFYADWCGPCRMMTPILESMSTVHTGVKFVKVNVDTLPALASQYEVTAMPTFLGFHNGKPTERLLGADRAGVERMLSKMK